MIHQRRPRSHRGRVSGLFPKALLCLSLWVSQAADAFAAFQSDDDLCDHTARTAASDHGIPVDLLRAVAEVESGRYHKPHVTAWPWTLNAEGRGQRFSSLNDAAARVQDLVAQGVTNFDVGCFQINYAWHGRAFASAQHMLDPFANADYAARFLKSLHEEFGDWTTATGAYHSRTDALADRYRSRIVDVLSRFLPDHQITPTPQPAPQAPKPNTYPLLASGSGHVTPGSLMPVANGTAARRPMF